MHDIGEDLDIVVRIHVVEASACDPVVEKLLDHMTLEKVVAHHAEQCRARSHLLHVFGAERLIREHHRAFESLVACHDLHSIFGIGFILETDVDTGAGLHRYSDAGRCEQSAGFGRKEKTGLIGICIIA